VEIDKSTPGEWKLLLKHKYPNELRIIPAVIKGMCSPIAQGDKMHGCKEADFRLMAQAPALRRELARCVLRYIDEYCAYNDDDEFTMFLYRQEEEQRHRLCVIAASIGCQPEDITLDVIRELVGEVALSDG
jgi:hypothetical protein